MRTKTDMEAEITKLLNRIAVLSEQRMDLMQTLSFYADKRNYLDDGDDISSIASDNGFAAIKALERAQ